MTETTVTEAQIDVSVRRLMLARMQLGMFDPPAQVKYAQIPYSVNESPEHDRLALQAAKSSLVLLKNDHLLPLSRDIKDKIALFCSVEKTRACMHAIPSGAQ